MAAFETGDGDCYMDTHAVELVRNNHRAKHPRKASNPNNAVGSRPSWIVPDAESVQTEGSSALLPIRSSLFYHVDGYQGAFAWDGSCAVDKLGEGGAAPCLCCSRRSVGSKPTWRRRKRGAVLEHSTLGKNGKSAVLAPPLQHWGRDTQDQDRSEWRPLAAAAVCDSEHCWG